MLNSVNTFLIFYISLAYARSFGPYYINPTMVENFPGNLPEKVEAFYYLQQVTMFKTVFKGEVDVHKTIGPLVTSLEIVPWVGNAFKKINGVYQAEFHPIACDSKKFLDLLLIFEPRNLFNQTDCTFLPGVHKIDMDMDFQMHVHSPEHDYNPLKILVHFHEKNEHGENVHLFGYSITSEITDYDLFKFTAMAKDNNH